MFNSINSTKKNKNTKIQIDILIEEKSNHLKFNHLRLQFILIDEIKKKRQPGHQ